MTAPAAKGPPFPQPPSATERSDTAITSAVGLIYSTALAMEAVVMPLLALRAGYSKPAIGILTALSAVTQLASRLGGAPAMRRIPDRTLVWVSCSALAGSALLLAWSARPAVFVVAELVQGASRGLFWTGSLTHLVRSGDSAVRQLAGITFISNFGQLGGPLLAGVISETSFSLALVTSAGVAVAASALARAGMTRLPPFEDVKGHIVARLWRRRQLRLGCWTGVTAGAWRGLVNSYLPVVLKEAGQTSAVVGVVVAAANGGSIAGAGVMTAVRERGQRWILPASILLAGAGIATCDFTAAVPLVAAAVAVGGGLGAGILQTVSPAVAATAVDANERGDAVVMAGSFRAGALFVAPIGTAGLLDVSSLPEALVVAGALMAVPIVSALLPRGAPDAGEPLAGLAGPDPP